MIITGKIILFMWNSTKQGNVFLDVENVKSEKWMHFNLECMFVLICFYVIYSTFHTRGYT